MADHNIDDIIDRDEFFGRPNDEEDDEQWFDGDHAAVEPLDVRVDCHYREHVSPLINLITGNLDFSNRYLRNEPEFGKLRQLELYADVLLPLIHRPGSARREFISAMETHGKESLEVLKLAPLFTGNQRADDFPLDAFSDFLEELSPVLMECQKLHHFCIWIDVDVVDIDELGARLISRLPQITKVTLWVLRSDPRYLPLQLLQSFRDLPNLHEFELSDANSRTICRCFRELSHAPNLRRLVYDTSTPLDETPTPLSVAEAQALSQLLRVNRLEAFELLAVRVTTVNAWRMVCDAIVESSQLKEVRVFDMEFGDDMNECFRILGSRLSDMKNLEHLDLRLGCPTDDDGSLLQERELDQDSQEVVLRGVSLVPKLKVLVLPNCYWEQPLVHLLNHLLVTSDSLRTLSIRGIVFNVEGTALSGLESGLRACKLVSLHCALSDDGDLCAIASCVGVNETIQELTLSRSPRPSFNTMTQICCELRLNRTLKNIVCETDCNTACYYPHSEQEVDESPESFGRLVDALSSNVELESVRLEPYSRTHAGLRSILEVYSRLNKEGRRYARRVDAPDFRQNAFRVLEAVNDSSDCLYVHLQEIPMIFRR